MNQPVADSPVLLRQLGKRDFYRWCGMGGWVAVRVSSEQVVGRRRHPQEGDRGLHRGMGSASFVVSVSYELYANMIRA